MKDKWFTIYLKNSKEEFEINEHTYNKVIKILTAPFKERPEFIVVDDMGDKEIISISNISCIRPSK
jgi:hypothetical protein